MKKKSLLSRLVTFALAIGMMLSQATAATPSLNYSAYLASGSIALNTEDFMNVTDMSSAVNWAQRTADRLKDINITSYDVKTVMGGAETAVAKSNTKHFDGDTLEIDGKELRTLLARSKDAASAVESQLKRADIEKAVPVTVRYLTDGAENWSILITFQPNIADYAPDVGRTEIIRIEVNKQCALSVDIGDLCEDLKRTGEAIQIKLLDRRQEDLSKPAFKIQSVAGVLTHPVTLSLSTDELQWNDYRMVRFISDNADDAGEEEALRSHVNSTYGTMYSSVTLSGSSPRLCYYAFDSVKFKDIGELETDVQKAIKALYRENIIGGIDQYTFGPERAVNRGTFAKFIMNTMREQFEKQKENPNKPSFIDVQGSSLREYIEAAAACGYIQGNGNKYNPQEQITRRAAYKIIGSVLMDMDGCKTVQAKFGKSATQYLRENLSEERCNNVLQNVPESMLEGFVYAFASGFVIDKKEFDKETLIDIMDRKDTAVIVYKLCRTVLLF